MSDSNIGGEPASGPDDVAVGMQREAEEGKGGSRSGVDYRERSQWLRAALLGANDGLLSTASLMVGVGAVKKDARTMILSGVAALVAGACSMAIGEFVSVCTQRDVQLSDHKRERHKSEAAAATAPASDAADLAARVNSNVSSASTDGMLRKGDRPEDLPKPIQAAVASALAFTVGASVPLISAAFVAEYSVRVGVLAGASSVALASFGAVGAIIGRSPARMACLRVLVGGWIAMLVTYGLLRLFASASGV